MVDVAIPFPVTALYAGMLAILLVWLGFAVTLRRAKTGIALGDGGDRQLTMTMRRQANFIEYVPLALVLLALAEANGAPVWALHGAGIALVLARLGHVQGFILERGSTVGRVGGTMLTWAVLLLAAAYVIAQAFGVRPF